jgi:hypothetical protein
MLGQVVSSEIGEVWLEGSRGRSRSHSRQAEVCRILLMTGRAQALLREALALPAEERPGVAAELLASLDGASGGGDPGEVQAAWASEVETRHAG